MPAEGLLALLACIDELKARVQESRLIMKAVPSEPKVKFAIGSAILT